LDERLGSSCKDSRIEVRPRVLSYHIAVPFAHTGIYDPISVSFRKHALTLQLHTAHILSAHASLEQKGKAIQDLREQKHKYVLPIFTPRNLITNFDW
jgi:hypothetical protein